MKAIITNGMANKDIIDCLITEHGVEIIFDSNDLADKFALSLNMSGISCINDENKVTVSYINQMYSRINSICKSIKSIGIWKDK